MDPYLLTHRAHTLGRTKSIKHPNVARTTTIIKIIRISNKRKYPKCPSAEDWKKQALYSYERRILLIKIMRC